MLRLKFAAANLNKISSRLNVANAVARSSGENVLAGYASLAKRFLSGV